MKIKNGMLWSDEFKAWIKKRYNEGWTASQIAMQAHDELGVSLSRNAVIGIAQRTGAIAERMKHRTNNGTYNAEGMRTAMITLCGPEWAIPDRSDVRRAA